MSGLTLFTRTSGGDLNLASYTGSKSYCWIWALCLSGKRIPFHITPRAERIGQWHHMIPLPFGRTLIISRQDFHKDPRHQVSA